MASPHAAGVAALIVSRFGQARRAARRPHHVAEPGRGSSCTAPRPSTPAPSRACRATPTRAGLRSSTRYCAGGTNFNGFYGYGIVDAYAAVGGRK